MAAKHKNQISHVNLDKAFANIRNYPGARTDRKVFKIIAEEANDEGVARFTTHMSKLLYRVSGAGAMSNSDGMSNSFDRLVREGLIKGVSYAFDQFNYPHGTVTIAPAYMLHTATTPEPSDGTERIDKLEKLSDENATSVAASVMEIKRTQRNVEDRIGALEKHNTVVETLLAISILVDTVGIGGLIGCVMRLH